MRSCRCRYLAMAASDCVDADVDEDDAGSVLDSDVEKEEDDGGGGRVAADEGMDCCRMRRAVGMSLSAATKTAASESRGCEGNEAWSCSMGSASDS